MVRVWNRPTVVPDADGNAYIAGGEEPSTWVQYHGFAFRIARENDASTLGVKFVEGRLVSYEFSPDDFP